MNRQERAQVVQRLRTAQDLIKFATNRLDSDLRATDGLIREIHGDLEEAESIAARAVHELRSHLTRRALAKIRGSK